MCLNLPSIANQKCFTVGFSFIVLKEKIAISDDIIFELNRIAIENSNLLNNKNETWYKL